MYFYVNDLSMDVIKCRCVWGFSKMVSVEIFILEI